MKPLYINGKFTAQSVTGVQRVAVEVVQALDRHFSTIPAARRRRCVLLCPAGARLPSLDVIEAREVPASFDSLQWWEQVSLPRAARDGMLLNLSGSAPMRGAERAFCLIHDAAVFDQPQAYTHAFKLWYRLLFRTLARRAAGLLTVSEFSRQRLAACLAIAPARFHVLINGADHFTRMPADDEVLALSGLQPQRYLLVVGTAKQTKNVAAVLAAWRALRPPPGDHLVWVGGQNTRVFAGADAAHHDVQADLAAGIIHAGFIDDARLKSLYSHAAGLVIASHYEGFGLPVVEAMVCGCPVAAARAASLPEVCGDAAIYFDPNDGAAIAQAMQRLLNDGAERERLRTLGRARVAAYSWDDSAQAMWDWLSAQAVFKAGP